MLTLKEKYLAVCSLWTNFKLFAVRNKTNRLSCSWAKEFEDWVYHPVSVLNTPATGQKQFSYLLQEILALEDKSMNQPKQLT